MRETSQPEPGPAARFLDAWDERLSSWAKDGRPAAPIPGKRPFDRSDSPRPLALHLTLAGTLAGRATAEASGLAPDLVSVLDGSATEPLRGSETSNTEQGTAVALEAISRLQRMFQGIDAYRRHPWRRGIEEPPCIWNAGSVRLLDHGAANGGQPILVIPSLVNRSHVLDLLPERSILGWMSGQGYRPLLLDWGEPGFGEAEFGVSDYARSPLVAAAEQAAADGPVPVLGYCMGGLFALALATLKPELVSRLAVIATPWDFDAPKGTAGMLRNLARDFGEDRIEQCLSGMGEAFGGIPVDFLQGIFALLDPNLAARKFSSFAALPADSFEAKLFVATEDWLNDGVPLTPQAGIDVLVKWCLENSTMHGEWRVSGQSIRPERVSAPTLVVTSATDRIAPAPSTSPLAERMPSCQLLQIDAGHVGMMVGRRAVDSLWRPLAKWFE